MPPTRDVSGVYSRVLFAWVVLGSLFVQRSGGNSLVRVICFQRCTSIGHMSNLWHSDLVFRQSWAFGACSCPSSWQRRWLVIVPLSAALFNTTVCPFPFQCCFPDPNPRLSPPWSSHGLFPLVLAFVCCELYSLSLLVVLCLVASPPVCVKLGPRGISSGHRFCARLLTIQFVWSFFVSHGKVMFALISCLSVFPFERRNCFFMFFLPLLL